jgi:CRISPR-associated protein Cmr1
LHGYTKLEYNVSFATPAFLAGADQQEAEWCTPPFKALLREWWRVVKAPEFGYRVVPLREAEHMLFGHAGDAKNSSQSKVRLRLAKWRPGTELNLHTTLRDVKLSTGNFPSPAAVYLGYGPIQNDKSRPAISNVNDVNTFSVLVAHDKSGDEVRRAIQLASWFGAVGSRSRNGWGSLSIEGEGLKDTSALSASALGECLRDWTDCLDLDWPHAIGKDQRGPLVWKTVFHSDWKQALKCIANLRAGLRRHFPLSKHSTDLQERHILAYQLRLKIALEEGKYRGIVTHVPCGLPQQLVEKLPNRGQTGDLRNMQLRVWAETHKFLDAPSTPLTRVSQ